MKEKQPDLNILRKKVLEGEKVEPDAQVKEADAPIHITTLYPQKEDFLALPEGEQLRLVNERGFKTVEEVVRRYYTGENPDLEKLREQVGKKNSEE